MKFSYFKEFLFSFKFVFYYFIDFYFSSFYAKYLHLLILKVTILNFTIRIKGKETCRNLKLKIKISKNIKIYILTYFATYAAKHFKTLCTF